MKGCDVEPISAVIDIVRRNSESSTIPKTVHLYWENNNGDSDLPPEIVSTINAWSDTHPNYTIAIWDRQSVAEYMPAVLGVAVPPLLDAAHFSSMRSDIVRFLALYLFGGVWCDMKLAPTEPFLDQLTNTSTPFFLERGSKQAPWLPENRSGWIRVSFMGAPPGDFFVLDVLLQIIANIQNRVPGGILGISSSTLLQQVAGHAEYLGRPHNFTILDADIIGTKLVHAKDSNQPSQHWSARQRTESVWESDARPLEIQLAAAQAAIHTGPRNEPPINRRKISGLVGADPFASTVPNYPTDDFEFHYSILLGAYHSLDDRIAELTAALATAEKLIEAQQQERVRLIGEAEYNYSELKRFQAEAVHNYNELQRVLEEFRQFTSSGDSS